MRWRGTRLGVACVLTALAGSWDNDSRDRVDPVLREIITTRCLRVRRSGADCWAAGPRDEITRVYEQDECLKEGSVTRMSEVECAKWMHCVHVGWGYPILTTTSRTAFARAFLMREPFADNTMRTLQMNRIGPVVSRIHSPHLSL